MSKRARRGNRTSTAFAILAVVIILLLVFGTIATVIIGSGGGGASGTTNDALGRVTPGAEVTRLETRIAAQPDDINSVAILAEVLANSGRVGESIPWFERAVTARPDDANLRLAFGRALARNGNQFDAELQLTKAVALQPNDPVMAFYLAQLYENMTPPRLQDARTWYERSIAANPESVVAGQARDQLATLSDATPAASPAASPAATP